MPTGPSHVTLSECMAALAGAAAEVFDRVRTITSHGPDGDEAVARELARWLVHDASDPDVDQVIVTVARAVLASSQR